MNDLERARKNLYILIERGTPDKILKASQHLDKLILQRIERCFRRKK